MNTINLNQQIRVKLNSEGLKILLEYHMKYSIPNFDTREYVLSKVDENGYYEVQLWEFMHIFGEHIHMCIKYPLENLNIEIL